MKKDETFDKWFNQNIVAGVEYVDAQEAWNHQQKKIDRLEKENAEWQKEHKRVTDHFLALGLHIKDLEAKLAKAVEALELWQAYSDGFAYDDRGNHRSEKDIYKEVEQTLAEISEKGEGE